MQLKDSSYKPSETATNSVDTIQAWLVNQIAKQLGIAAQTIKMGEPLTRYGLDSIDSVTIVGDMEDWLGAELPSTLLWDYPTIEKAAHYLVNEAGVSPAEAVAAEPVAAVAKEEAASEKGGWGRLWGKTGR